MTEAKKRPADQHDMQGSDVSTVNTGYDTGHLCLIENIWEVSDGSDTPLAL